MPTEDLDDDYVREPAQRMMRKPARRSTPWLDWRPSYPRGLRFPAYFISNRLLTLLPFRRPTVKAPKPNTRFLRNILRETDNHNAALLAKEAEESRARLRALHRERTDV